MRILLAFVFTMCLVFTNTSTAAPSHLNKVPQIEQAAPVMDIQFDLVLMIDSVMAVYPAVDSVYTYSLVKLATPVYHSVTDVKSRPPERYIYDKRLYKPLKGNSRRYCNGNRGNIPYPRSCIHKFDRFS